MAPKKAIFIIIVILATLLSVSFAGLPEYTCTPCFKYRPSRPISRFDVSANIRCEHRKLVTAVGGVKEQSARSLSGNRGVTLVHPRILSVKTNDYGGYDPSPSFSKPSWKPIPN